MKHLDIYENWLANIFKDDDTEYWQKHIDYIDETHGFNRLMKASSNGNFKKVKYLIPEYLNKINDINIQKTKNSDKIEMTALMYAVIGDGDIWDKKKIITLLIENGANADFVGNNLENFYDLITDNKLKKWVEINYNDIINVIETKKNTKKYNL